MKKREGESIDRYFAGFSIIIDDFYRNFFLDDHSPDELYQFLREHIDDIGSIEVLRDGEFYCRYKFSELDKFRDEWCDI